MSKEIKIKSKIYLEDKVDNKLRKFGSNKHYYVCNIIGIHGTKIKAAFTRSDLEKAVFRANNNPEDFIDDSVSFLDKLFGE